MKIKKSVLLLPVAVVAFGAQAAVAGNVGVNLNINVGEPQRPVVVAPPPPVYVAPPPPVHVAPPQPVYVAQPAYPPPVVNVELDDVQFIYPPTLGFYVAVDVPYDVFYCGNSYFLFRDGRWFQARSSRGPWAPRHARDLPPALRRHRLERIRECRTREYAAYNRDRDHYRGRHFRGDRESWKDHKREMKEIRKEERRLEKEERKHDKRHEKELRREEKRHEAEARREERWR